LFPEDLDVDFGELAHVIPASPGGPRSVSSEEVSLESRAHHGNLILLCANCHTVIDKASKAYPSETLYRWKQNRVAEIHVAVGARRFEIRAEARACIEQQLLENRAIHAKYVPVDDPYSEGDPVLSRRHARANILPNNRKILQVLEANQHLLTPNEQEALAVYRLHVQQFEDRHVLGDARTGIERFPKAIQSVLLG